MIKTRMQGARELDRVLARLPKKIGEKVLVGAVRKGAQVIRKDALQRLPGFDKKSITTRRVRSGRASVTIRVGIVRDKFYLMFREFGTRPHKITSKSGKALIDPQTGKSFGTVIMHPGQPPRPFLRPAFDTRKVEALRVIGQTLGKNIERAAVKLAGSFAKSGLARRGRRRR